MRARTPFEKGRSACRRGKRMNENPYTHETSIQSKNNREWASGYAAQAQDEADAMRAEALPASAAIP